MLGTRLVLGVWPRQTGGLLVVTWRGEIRVKVITRLYRYVLILKPLLLAMRPSAAVEGWKYSRPSLCTEILKGLFWLQTVCPAVPVTAVVGTAPRHLSSRPQYLRWLSEGGGGGRSGASTHLSLVSIGVRTLPVDGLGESHWPSAMKM